VTDALVLAGGNIKGAYEAGAIHALFENGFEPRIVTGISVGALNAAYIAAHQSIDYPSIGRGLADFWGRSITEPAALVRRRSFLSLAWRVLRKRWDGVIDTARMAALVRRELGPLLPYPLALPRISANVGTVNLNTGAIVYVNSTDPLFLDAVIASTAEPVTMPLRQLGGAGAWHYDGGLRDIAPLAEAIRLGASRIIVVLCHPKGFWSSDLPKGDLLQLVDRVASIVSNEILENDLARTEQINQVVRQLARRTVASDSERSPLLKATGEPYREILIYVVRPTVGFAVNVASFTRADIAAMIGVGYGDAFDWRIRSGWEADK
jgi:NTE family protein